MANVIDVAKQCIEVYGAQKQILQNVKEMTELILEHYDVLDGKGNIDKVASEFADVKFTLMQVEMIYNAISNGKFSNTVEVEMQYKVDRQAARLMTDKELFKDGVPIVKEAPTEVKT